jgi:hypothetical protein
LANEDANKWKLVMDEEYQSLIQNDIWSQTKLFTNQNMVGCKLVYKIKLNSSGQVGRFKAMLVVKGYSQIEGLDYNDTFSLVINIISFIVLLIWVATIKLTIHHMDVKSASYIYMFQLEGYINPNKKDLVYKLHKTIYGLNKALENGTKELMIT